MTTDVVIGLFQYHAINQRSLRFETCLCDTYQNALTYNLTPGSDLILELLN